ncbi:Uncharacterised protein r2_g1049 [Pycnogonum litorale]
MLIAAPTNNDLPISDTAHHPKIPGTKPPIPKNKPTLKKPFPRVVDSEPSALRRERKQFEPETDADASGGKAEKEFSFITPDELSKMKDEEEMKMMKMTDDELKSYVRMMANSSDEDIDSPSTIRKEVSGIVEEVIAASPSTAGVVRTAKAERRMKEKLKSDGNQRCNDGRKVLSASEERALQAEKRAAWRQARLKSLEQDALKAQLVLAKVQQMSGGAKHDMSTVVEGGSICSTDGESKVPDVYADSEDANLVKTLKFVDDDPSEAEEANVKSASINDEAESSVGKNSGDSPEIKRLVYTIRDGSPKTRQTERIVGEKVTRRTEEYVDERSGENKIRTVEYVEKVIETEIETTKERLVGLKIGDTGDDDSTDQTASAAKSSSPKHHRNKRKRLRKR